MTGGLPSVDMLHAHITLWDAGVGILESVPRIKEKAAALATEITKDLETRMHPGAIREHYRRLTTDKLAPNGRTHTHTHIHTHTHTMYARMHTRTTSLANQAVTFMV